VNRGEAETFAAFYRHHQRAVLTHLRAQVRPPEVVAELAAETFAAALRDAPRRGASGRSSGAPG